ncbi:phosphomevalonate kinase [Salinibacillus kushneri]|uniref:phosphomevalonate kinase n=1 Tax=Salinibacillus kushneri TaxID=237682 RepID=A0A1I0IRW5_9BACI|nr:phosphomevalonate kinase [Salinibacillus kushneri]SET99267.1 phosphomevalonate kinase [Salinibacillus kushneri]
MPIYVRVPGKLMIAGEYAVLEPNQNAIVAAVNRYVYAKITSSKNCEFTLPDLGFESVSWEVNSRSISFSNTDEKLLFVQNTIKVVQDYLNESSVQLSPFHLTVTSELDDPSGKKYGLGSSAAVVVSVVSAILALAEQQNQLFYAPKELIFKLAVIAHVKTQGSGSGADVAASTYGGWLRYSAFQAQWLLQQIETSSSITTLIEQSWPYLSIQPVIPPETLQLCVGWTGKAVSTGPMIRQLKDGQQENNQIYQTFLKDSYQAVEGIVSSFEHKDAEESLFYLKKNRSALVKLGKEVGMLIETPNLAVLSDLAEQMGGSGKSSGAGGGDCGIAFVTSQEQVVKLSEAWKKAGIEPLNLDVDHNGSSWHK